MVGSTPIGHEKTSEIRLSIVVPTFNESLNIDAFLSRIEKTLGASGWETIFVDDDSPDETAAVVRNIARVDRRVRCLQRIGRRGLSSAVIEGMLAASAATIAVMDADLQHDETILPKMLTEIEENRADLVVATRYDAGGSMSGCSESRMKMSRIATWVSHVVLVHPVSDPMSGFFMITRQTLDKVVHRLSGLGFKILLDILATEKTELKIAEVPYRFRDRYAGDSKLDRMVVWEYGLLLADKKIGRLIPARFLSFSLIGGIGVLVHMGVLTGLLINVKLSFPVAQSMAALITMIFNFALNNQLTYRDRRLKGMAWLKGLVSFVAACSIGALANIGIASFLFQNRAQWIIAALSGVLVGAVWNYVVTQLYTWGKHR
jgi:dolichol-phosphate mannosyltransferase